MMMLNSEGLAVMVVLVYDTATLGTCRSPFGAAAETASPAPAAALPLPVKAFIRSEIGFPRNAPAILLLSSPNKP